MKYIGIDVHKKICVACIKDEGGTTLTEIKFSNNKEGFNHLFSVVGEKKARAVMESTGNYWLQLYDALEAQGIEVILANPRKTRVIAESNLKTDSVDAAMLADLLRANLIAPCYVPPPEVRDIRALIRERMSLKKECTRVKNRIHSLLAKHELPPFPGSDLFGKKGLQWLEDQKEHLLSVDWIILEIELVRLKTLVGLIEKINGDIAVIAQQTEEVSLLMTITGVDYYTALLFTSEIGDIHRFSSSSKLSSWIGLVPRVHQSADTYYHGRITKQGSPLVRWALIQAAQVAVRWDSHWREVYERISSHAGKKKAIVAIARKLAVTMYCMLTRKEPYRYCNEETYRRKVKKLERIINTTPKNRGEIVLLSS